jgi:hypothetical protein
MQLHSSNYTAATPKSDRTLKRRFNDCIHILFQHFSNRRQDCRRFFYGE